MRKNRLREVELKIISILKIKASIDEYSTLLLRIVPSPNGERREGIPIRTEKSAILYRAITEKGEIVEFSGTNLMNSETIELGDTVKIDRITVDGASEWRFVFLENV